MNRIIYTVHPVNDKLSKPLAENEEKERSYSVRVTGLKISSM